MRARLGEQEIEADGPLRIGRDPSCDLVVRDDRASRLHAELRPAGSGWEIEDLGSTNGTFCDGMRISRLAVTHAVVVRLGSPVDGEALHLIPESSVGGTVIEAQTDPQRPPTVSYISPLVHDLDPSRTRKL